MIGLSTYAFFWQWSERNPEPLSLEQMLASTRDLGVDLFQVCDFPPLDQASDAGLTSFGDAAQDLGITLELGTRGIQEDHLLRYLDMAEQVNAKFVRSMVRLSAQDPSLEEGRQILARVMERYAERGVALGLETYEQLPTQQLVDLVQDVGHPALGIVLDPGNCVAALEPPRQTIDLTAPLVNNLHIKDFAFSRRDGWVGFTYAGTPLGEGLLEYDYMINRVQPFARNINQVVEHWLPWTDSFAETARLEQLWTQQSVTYLRSKNA